MSLECWTPKAKITHSEFKISTASPQQKLLREIAPVLPLALHLNTTTNKISKFLNYQFHGCK